MELSEKITYLRKQKGWSQEQLSGKLEVSRQAVYKWEAGLSQPEIDKLKKLSKIFGISFNELLDDDIDINEASLSSKMTKNSEAEEKRERISEKSQTNEGEKVDTSIPSNDDVDNNTPIDADIEVHDVLPEEDPLKVNEENVSENKGQKKRKGLIVGLVACITMGVLLICVLIGVIAYYLRNEDDIPPKAPNSSTANSAKEDENNTESSTLESGSGGTGVPDNENPSVEKLCKVSFKVSGGTPVKDMYVDEGALIAEPVTKRQGHILLGWVEEGTYREWNFDVDTVTEEVTLCAIWMKDNSIEITLYKNDGSGIKTPVRILPGESQYIEDIYSDEKRAIIGWATAPAGKMKFPVFEPVVLDAPTTLYAVWAPSNACTVTWCKNDSSGEKYRETVAKGTSLKLLSKYESDHILGWSLSPQGEIKYGYGETITINENITLYAARSNSEGLYFTDIDGSTCILEYYTGNAESLVIPESFNGKKVVGIKDFAFMVTQNNQTLKHLELPYGITTIGESTLYGLSSLEELLIPESVKAISTKAFNSIPTILNYRIDGANSEFCDIDGVLYNKERTALVSYPKGRQNIEYYIPQGTHIIGEFSFYGASLKSVFFPDGVGVIRKSAFEWCIFLESVDLGYGVNYVEARAFADCHELKEINFLQDLIDIGNEAFENCFALAEVHLDGSVNVISYHAFYCCVKLETVVIGGGITDRVDENAFEGCPAFEGIIYSTAYSN